MISLVNITVLVRYMTANTATLALTVEVEADGLRFDINLVNIAFERRDK